MKIYLRPLLLFIFLIQFPLLSEHTILDSSKIYKHWDTEIIKEIRVNALHIRHVQIKNATWCAIDNLDEFIELSGPINDDVPYIVEQLLKEISKKVGCIPSNRYTDSYPLEVYLNSGGGYLEDGFELGEIFRKYGVRTKIPQGSICYSSCATAFLGGIRRHMDKESAIGFHAPYSYKNSTGEDIVCQNDNQDLKKYYKKMMNDTESQKILGSTSSEILYERTMSYCGRDKGWVLNADAAEIFLLANNN